MSEAEIFATVKKIAVEELDVEADQVTMEANIKDDLEADSLDLFEIVNELEDEYDIELDADESTKTVADVVALAKAPSSPGWVWTFWPIPCLKKRLTRPARQLAWICRKFGKMTTASWMKQDTCSRHCLLLNTGSGRCLPGTLTCQSAGWPASP